MPQKILKLGNTSLEWAYSTHDDASSRLQAFDYSRTVFACLLARPAVAFVELKGEVCMNRSIAPGLFKDIRESLDLVSAQRGQALARSMRRPVSFNLLRVPQSLALRQPASQRARVQAAVPSIASSRPTGRARLPRQIAHPRASRVLTSTREATLMPRIELRQETPAKRRTFPRGHVGPSTHGTPPTGVLALPGLRQGETPRKLLP